MKCDWITIKGDEQRRPFARPFYVPGFRFRASPAIADAQLANAGAAALLEHYGAQDVFAYILMNDGTMSVKDFARIFSVSSFELG